MSGLSKELWATNLSLAQSCLKNSFVQGILHGNLPREKFVYYVGQDAFFLRTFARAYVLAAAKSSDFDGFQELHSLAQGVVDELELHKSYAKKWGVDIVKVKAAPATRRYTDFVMATAWSSDVGTTIAALTPCMRLYAWLGQEMIQLDHAPHQYSHWIETYANPEFEKLAARLELLLDTYGQPGRKIEEAYSYAMDCELAFFQAGWDRGKEE